MIFEKRNVPGAMVNGVIFFPESSHCVRRHPRRARTHTQTDHTRAPQLCVVASLSY